MLPSQVREGGREERRRDMCLCIVINMHLLYTHTMTAGGNCGDAGGMGGGCIATTGFRIAC